MTTTTQPVVKYLSIITSMRTWIESQNAHKNQTQQCSLLIQHQEAGGRQMPSLWISHSRLTKELQVIGKSLFQQKVDGSQGKIPQTHVDSHVCTHRHGSTCLCTCPPSSSWGDSGRNLKWFQAIQANLVRSCLFLPRKNKKTKKQQQVCVGGMGGYRSHFLREETKMTRYEKCPPSLFRNKNNTMGFHLTLIKMATTQNKNIIIKNHSKQKVTMLVKSRKIITLCTVSENIK